MIKIFTGVQFVVSILFTILIYIAPDIGLTTCNSRAMIGSIGMADFMWLMTLVLILSSLAKYEKDRKEDETEGSRNY